MFPYNEWNLGGVGDLIEYVEIVNFARIFALISEF